MDALSGVMVPLGAGLFVLLALFGFLSLWRAHLALEERRATRAWPQAAGVMLEGRVETSTRRLNRRTLLGFRAGSTVYLPALAYSYRVDGVEYRGTRYKNSWPGEWYHPLRSKVEALLEEYPAGKAVQVRYNPLDPAQSWLEVEARDGTLHALRAFGAALLTGALLLAAGGALVVVRQKGEAAARERLQAELQSSPAQLALPAAQIKANLEGSLGLACQESTFPATSIAYHGWTCRPPGQDGVPLVDVWSRAANPARADYVEAIVERGDPAAAAQFLSGVCAAVLPPGDAVAAQQWAAETFAGLGSGSAESSAGGAPLKMLALSESRLSLQIGMPR